jgi:hypothetical protein
MSSLLLLLWACHTYRAQVHTGYSGLKPEGKIPHGRHRRKREKIKINLPRGKMGAWTGLIWLRIGTCEALVNAVMNLRVP